MLGGLDVLGLPPRALAMLLLRKIAGLSQEELAFRLGVSRYWVIRREGGKVQIKDIEIPGLELACGVDSGTFAFHEIQYRQEDAERSEVAPRRAS